MTKLPLHDKFSEEELHFIEEAAKFFEQPGLFIKSMNWLGQPIESLQKRLPQGAQDQIAKATHHALEKALEASVRTLAPGSKAAAFADANRAAVTQGHVHTVMTAFSGIFGGFLGLPALLVELPITTVVMLRSIAQIAREMGEDISQAATHMECLYVFSLGGPSKHDDATDSAYYSSRVAFANIIREASKFISSMGALEVLRLLEKGGAPKLVQFVGKVGTQFQVRVSKKAVAQSAPVLGALGGGALNAAFTHYYNHAARCHFGLKRIERTHGVDDTRAVFEHYSAKYRLPGNPI